MGYCMPAYLQKVGPKLLVEEALDRTKKHVSEGKDSKASNAIGAFANSDLPTALFKFASKKI
ncbi:unnamed protein product [Hymenolepis diminuta]|uniref:Uncharacterized protein n=1 Tax=Hymenolepis diminuta TaxID=6216 RepID=A0A564XZS2_HYMDI|nr:unnamed protein product [Hymenolepis diminuta]